MACAVCGQQKPGKKGQGESGWTVQAKLDICVWLGEYRKSRDQPYLSQLPPGYEPLYEDDDDDESRPPIAIVYPGTSSSSSSSSSLSLHQYKMCVLVYECLRQSAPIYLSELCIPVAATASRSHLRSAM